MDVEFSRVQYRALFDSVCACLVRRDAVATHRDITRAEHQYRHAPSNNTSALAARSQRPNSAGGQPCLCRRAFAYWACVSIGARNAADARRAETAAAASTVTRFGTALVREWAQSDRCLRADYAQRSLVALHPAHCGLQLHSKMRRRLQLQSDANVFTQQPAEPGSITHIVAGRLWRAVEAREQRDG